MGLMINLAQGTINLANSVKNLFRRKPSGTIFVDVNIGLDTNNGKFEASPFRTMSKAFATAVAGDVIIATKGIYVESEPWIIKDGVNWYFDKDTVIVPIFNDTLFNSNPDTRSFFRCVSLTDTRETLGNYGRGGYYYAKGASPYANFVVINRNNVVLDGIKAEGFDFNFFTAHARKDLLKFPPYHDTGTTRTFSFLTGVKIKNSYIDDCCKFVGVSNYLGNGTGGYGSGAVQYGGTDGFELFNTTIVANKRGVYRDGYPVKYANKGFNKNERFRYCKFIRSKDNQYFSFLIEWWYHFGGALIEHCYFEGGGIDYNGGKKAMLTNESSTYSVLSRFNHFYNKEPRKTVNIYNADGTIASTSQVQLEAHIIEPIDLASNGLTGVAGVTGDVEDFIIEKSRFENIFYAYFFDLHTAACACRNFIFRNNLLINSGRGRVHAEVAAGGVATFDGLLDEHNTAVNTDASITNGQHLEYNVNCANFTYQNNINVGFSNAPIALSRGYSSTFTNLTLKKNLNWNCGNSNALKLGSGPMPSGYSNTDLTPANPNFKDVARNDYRLSTPIIGAVTTLTDDIDGNTRTSATPTVGAYE